MACPFVRGQMCPSGSIGRPHKGQGGRPPSISRSAGRDERERLPARDADARRRLLDAGRRVALLVGLDELVGRDQDPVFVTVVCDAERADWPLGVDRLDERDGALVRHGVGLGQVGEHALQELAECRDLLLLDLPCDRALSGARLEIERALAGRTDGARGEHSDVAEVERLAHLSSLSSRRGCRSPSSRSAPPGRQGRTRSRSPSTARSRSAGRGRGGCRAPARPRP